MYEFLLIRKYLDNIIKQILETNKKHRVTVNIQYSYFRAITETTFHRITINQWLNKKTTGIMEEINLTFGPLNG